ncbi:MAG TPA: hypothetical protein VIX86_04595 [Streptosporangiaceae bacterium]
MLWLLHLLHIGISRHEVFCQFGFRRVSHHGWTACVPARDFWRR